MRAKTDDVKGVRMNRGILTMGVVLASVLAFAVIATTAGAAQFAQRGAPTTFPIGGNSVAVDQSSGSVYVVNGTAGIQVEKFDPDGTPSGFSGLGGGTSLNVGASSSFEPKIAVDNSGTATQGRFYVTDINSSKIYAFEPSGRPVGGNFPVELTSSAEEIAVEPGTGNLWTSQVHKPIQFTPAGVRTGLEVSETGLPGTGFNFDVDSHSNFYFRLISPNGVFKTDAAGQFLYKLEGYSADVAVDDSNDFVYRGGQSSVSEFTANGTSIGEFGSLPFVRSLAVNGNNGYVYVLGEGLSIFAPGPAVTLADADLDPASNFEPSSAVVHGTVNPDSVETTECSFQYSQSEAFDHSAPCDQGNVLTGSADAPVGATLTGLTQGATYNYRLVVTNVNGVSTTAGGTFVPSSAPLIKAKAPTEVHSDGTVIHGLVDPGGARTTYHFEYGPEDCSMSTCTSTSEKEAGSGLAEVPVETVITGLQAGTTYHYRVVATNQSGTTDGPDRTVRTFPTVSISSGCPNLHVRQQTGAAQLLDCRAYELVSAANSGGYDVVSSLVPGQEPYGSYPGAGSRVLYSVKDGGIPGAVNPTNRGRDPYLATRGAEGWATQYVGLPSDNPFAEGPFSSTVADADPALRNLAFGGEICSPCFADGSTGIPLRLADGSLVQGMAGSLDPDAPATADGLVAKHFSAEGSHFLFGSTSRFEPDGNENGDVSIYMRDLSTGVTQVVSKTPAGANLPCLQGDGKCHSPADTDGIAALDVSADGSRVIVAQKVGSDADGNVYWHPYMHIGTSPNTVDLAPGSTEGVLFDGMTADGNKVFLTSREQLAGADGDSSADIYEDELDGSGPVTPKLISTGGGGAGNVDACTPPEDWNTPMSVDDCSALAIAGGGGVASGDGTFYFLSPEKLDGDSNGVQGQANLYVVAPGAAPHFVATIDSSVGKPPPPAPAHPLVTTSFGSGHSSPAAMAVDQSSGDLYVAEHGATSGVTRFKPNGDPDPFTAGPGAGTNLISMFLSSPEESQIGFDSSATSLLTGSLYVTAGASSLRVFSKTGEAIGEINGHGNGNGSFGEECGVAVDNSNGAVYVGDYGGYVWRYLPISNATPVSDSDYEVTGVRIPGFHPCLVGTDSAGHAYAKEYGGPLREFEASSFAPGSPPSTSGQPVPGSLTAFTTDPETNELYVDTGSRIDAYTPSGELVQSIGAGQIANSQGVAISSFNHHVYVAGAGSVYDFGYEPPPYHLLDNPAIVHAREDASMRSFGDFHVTPSGSFAAFSSGQDLSAFESELHSEVYRYDTGGDGLVCASCLPTEAGPEGEGVLSRYGLGLTDQGTVFFNSTDPLVPRDLDQKEDAYEWEPQGAGEPEACPAAGGCLGLVSTGSSPFASSLFGVSADGTDAFFFTRDSLVRDDANGSHVKIYDARVEGGFPYAASTPPCKASDECHGAGSAKPAEPPIATRAGAGGNVTPRSSCDLQKLKLRGSSLTLKARHLSRRARKASGRRAAQLEGKARHVAKQAQRTSKAAARCRTQGEGR